MQPCNLFFHFSPIHQVLQSHCLSRWYWQSSWSSPSIIIPRFCLTEIGCMCGVGSNTTIMEDEPPCWLRVNHTQYGGIGSTFIMVEEFPHTIWWWVNHIQLVKYVPHPVWWRSFHTQYSGGWTTLSMVEDVLHPEWWRACHTYYDGKCPIMV